MGSVRTKKARDFDPRSFLAGIGEGRKILSFDKKRTIFTQGDVADSVFYLQTGKIKLTVVSKNGKEATIGILTDDAFFGEGALAGQALRMGSATTVTDCTVLRIDKKSMMQALHKEHAFSDMFVAYLLARNIRTVVPKISQETLAEMVGTTRSRVSFFMTVSESWALWITTAAACKFIARCSM
jgi:CRP-like cAMP-binding protein